MKTIEYGVGHNDQQRFIQFISALQGFIAELIFREDNNSFVTELREYLPASWKETAEHFTEMRDRLALMDPLKLTLQGLTGKEMDFKFAAINYSARQFHEVRHTRGMVGNDRQALSRLLALFTELVRDMEYAGGDNHAISSYLVFLNSALCEK